jgi:hypothetical protein
MTGAETSSGSGLIGSHTFAAGTTTVTYTATDGCGNSSTCFYMVNVNNALDATITGTTTVAQGSAPPPNVRFTGLNGVQNYIFYFTINGGPQQFVITSGSNFSDVAQPTGTLGTFVYSLVKVVDGYGCEKVFSPQPTATINVVTTVPDLAPTPVMDVLSFNAGDVGIDRDFIVVINEIAGAPTSGTISFRIIKLAEFTISFNPVSGVSNVFGGTSNTNSDFTFTDAGAFYLVQTNVSIPANGIKIAGFRIQRNPGVPANTSKNISNIILPGSGGETNVGNNIKSVQITAN